MKKLFLTLLCVVFLCAAAPAMADVDHSLNLFVDNDSEYAWSGFNFFIFEYPAEVQPLYPSFFNFDIENVKFNDSGPASPESSQILSKWEKSEDGQMLGLFFESDPVYSGATASFLVDIFNPDGALYVVVYAPVPVVPEPISSTLFLIGGAVLGFRRFKKRVSS